jgi:hypothetical protein
MIRSEILSLRRISHRLVMTSDGDLPEILRALLPRVLLRMQQNESKLDTRMRGEPNHESERNEIDEIENIQIVLKEIVTHALERVRGLEATMPIPWVFEVASFLCSVCTVDDRARLQGSLCNSRMLALDLLQEGILRLYKLGQFDYEIISCVLCAALQAVDWFHQYSSLSIQHLECLFKASWIVLDTIAVGNKFPPLFAFNCYLGETNFKTISRVAPVVLTPSTSVQDAAAKFGVGMLHFFLDVILFHPDLSNTADYNFEQWMRHRSILTQHSLRASLQQRGANNLILSVHHHDSQQTLSVEPVLQTETCNISYRLNYRANSDKIASSEEIRKETRNIKLACYRYASLLFNDTGNITSTLRALLLSVIAQSDPSLNTEGKAQFRRLMSGVQGIQRIWHTKYEGEPRHDVMIGLLSSLLILALNKEKVNHLWQNIFLHAGCKMEWENILGPVSLLQYHRLSLDAASSVLEFTREQMSVSVWWQNLKEEDEEKDINIKILLQLLFEVAEDAVGLTSIYTGSEEQPLDVQLLQRYLRVDEAKLCALGAGMLRKLSEKFLGNQYYNKRFCNYFNFVSRILDLTTSIYSMVLSCENDHPTIPSRLPDISFDNVDVIGNFLESQWLSAPARFRGECYHIIGKFVQHHDVFVPEPSDLNFFKIPGNLLICLMAEEDEILKEAIVVSLNSVLHAYEARLAQESSSKLCHESNLYLSNMLPIILAASCSYNSFVRLLAVRCVSGMLRFFDQSVSCQILNFLAEDSSLEVSNAVVDGISKLGVLATSPYFPFVASSKGDGTSHTLSCTSHLGTNNSTEDERSKLTECIQGLSSSRDCPALSCSIKMRAKASHEKIERCIFCQNVGLCSTCGKSSHYPAWCTDISKWNGVYKDCSSEARRCAACNATITKTRGCCHVKCTKCNLEACFICHKNISPYSVHVCNVYDHSRDELRTLYMQMYAANDGAEKFAHDQLKQLHDASGSQLPTPLFFKINNPTQIEQSIYALIACRKFLKYLSVRMYFVHEDGMDQNLSVDDEEPLCQFRKLHSALQVFGERLNRLTEMDNEEETISYGISGIPLYLRSLSLYTNIALDLKHRLEQLIERNYLFFNKECTCTEVR